MAPPQGLNPPGPPGPRQRRRRPLWLRMTLLTLILVPIAEIVVVILLGKAIGGWPVFLLLVACSALGAVLVKKEGHRTWVALRLALNSGKMPARELADAALVLVGGVMLLTPGFITAVVGLFFLLPLTRPITRRWLELVVGRRMVRAWAPGASGGYRPGFPPGGMGGAGGGSSRPPGSTGGSGNSGNTGRKPPPDDDVIEGEIL